MPRRYPAELRYSDALAEKILQRVALGNSLPDVSKLAGFPSHKTIHAWKDRYPEFGRRWRELKDMQLGMGCRVYVTDAFYMDLAASRGISMDEVIRIARERAEKARCAGVSPKGIRSFALDNPFTEETAWQLMLSEALKSSNCRGNSPTQEKPRRSTSVAHVGPPRRKWEPDILQRRQRGPKRSTSQTRHLKREAKPEPVPIYKETPRQIENKRVAKMLELARRLCA